MKSRTDNSITVKCTKITEGTSPLTYSVSVTGSGSQAAQKNCDERASECTVSELSTGRPYNIAVMSCITGATPGVCSDASDAITIKTLPKGRLMKIIYSAIIHLITSNTALTIFSSRQSSRKTINYRIHSGNNHAFKRPHRR